METLDALLEHWLAVHGALSPVYSRFTTRTSAVTLCYHREVLQGSWWWSDCTLAGGHSAPILTSGWCLGLASGSSWGNRKNTPGWVIHSKWDWDTTDMFFTDFHTFNLLQPPAPLPRGQNRTSDQKHLWFIKQIQTHSGLCYQLWACLCQEHPSATE